MPKKSKKSKSKRLTLRQKHKIIRKVKEHHRKKAKLLRKVPKQAKKEPKDPGIPSQWPFKEELLKDLAWQKQRAQDQEQARRDARRAAKAAKRTAEEAGLGDEEMEGEEDMAPRLTVADVAEEAARSQAEYRERNSEAAGPGATAGDGDGSRRAFLKEFHKVVEAADVVIEVLDARDPAGTRCADVERAVLRAGAGGQAKHLILLLNKIDLVPREVAEAWLKYLRQEHPTVAFKCSTQKQAAKLGQRKGGSWGKRQKREAGPKQDTAFETSGGKGGGLAGAVCLGADTLLQMLKNYARSGALKTSITVGIVGLPNVGKSSLINSLKRARVAQTGNTPGITRAVQEVHLDKHVTLIDSPGIVFASAATEGAAAAALRNCVKVEKLADPQAAVSEILRRCQGTTLMKIYKLAAFDGTDEFLSAVATARGRLLRGGVPDRTAAARLVLQDWNNGTIPYYTVPPDRETAPVEGAVLVDSWGPDFDPEKVYADERSAVIGVLPSLDEGARMFCLAKSAGAVSLAAPDGAMEEDDPKGGAAEMGEDLQEEKDEDEEEGGSDMSEGDGPPMPGASRPLTAVQTPALYDQEGQYNPHAARAERKRRKKSKAVREATGVAKEDEEYDFAEGFAGRADAEFDDEENDEEGGDGEEGEEDGGEVPDGEGEGDDFDWGADGDAMSEGDGPSDFELED